MKTRPKKTAGRLDGGKKLIAMTREMETDIKLYCRARGIDSASELVRQAVASYIYDDYDDGALKLQGLRDLSLRASELRDMLELVFRYLVKMHTNLLGYFAEIDAPFANAAYRSAQDRHDKFFAAFQAGLKNDPPFFERLLHTYFTEGGSDAGR
jgi:hypothetical protein